MTALDKFEPIGELIHPYDFYELIESVHPGDWLEYADSPNAMDEADYLRNRHKIGSSIIFQGKIYFQTTSVIAKTKRFA